MTESEVFYSYTGPVDYMKIDVILKDLKETREFIEMNRTTSKRTYAIMVECLENILKNSVNDPSGNRKFLPFVEVGETGGKIRIRAGNPIHADKKDRLILKLDEVNRLDENALTLLHEREISRKPGKGENGAGLGFILMRLKSGNELEYSFTDADNKITLFEIQILINKFVMRKLIVNQTSNSPRVVLDPERNQFEISGESRPPDVQEFYGEVFRWLDDYSVHLEKAHDRNDPVVFNFDFEYFNSSSAKCILDFCKQLAGFREKGNRIEVKWHYEEEDIDMLEVGREMSKIAKFPFEYVQKDIK